MMELQVWQDVLEELNQDKFPLVYYTHCVSLFLNLLLNVV